MRLLFGVLILVWLVSSMACAAVPPVISYQGKLMQPNGTPIPDGTYIVHFAIYDAPTGGDALWGETNSSVLVKGGLFAVLLGSVNNLGANILDSQNRYLGIKVGGDAELSPRQRIASVATALRAGEADVAKTVLDGGVTTSKIADNAVTTPKITDGAILSAKIADGAVISAKIPDNSITGTKIANGAVSTSAIADGAVSAAKAPFALAGPGDGYFIQGGQGGTGSGNVGHTTFPKPFSQIVSVVVTPYYNWAADTMVTVAAVSNTGFDAYFYMSNGVARDSQAFYWMAIGK